MQGAFVTVYPDRNNIWAPIKGTILVEDDLGITVRYRYQNEDVVSFLPWATVSRVQIHRSAEAAA